VVQKAGPQTRVPLARKDGDNRSEDQVRGFRAEEDVTELWCVETHDKAAERLESPALATGKRGEACS